MFQIENARRYPQLSQDSDSASDRDTNLQGLSTFRAIVVPYCSRSQN